MYVCMYTGKLWLNMSPYFQLFVRPNPQGTVESRFHNLFRLQELLCVSEVTSIARDP